MQLVYSIPLCAVLAAVALARPEDVHDARRIADIVNAAEGVTWTATGDHKFNGVSFTRIDKLMGARKSEETPTVDGAYSTDASIPAEFDARQRWAQCADVIGNIRDQSECGSCWAVAAASAMSDRLCIASQGKKKVSISAANLMECCHGFFGGDCGNGCEGGYLPAAWRYFANHGIVTGSNYTLKQGCQPYPFAPCEHHISPAHPDYPPCPKTVYNTPRCSKDCQTGFPGEYNADKYYGGQVMTISDNARAMQEEIMTNGPMEVAFTVYEDFLTYKSGVYHHVTGRVDGGHAVRVIGWGVESGVDYWLVANSWNKDWGLGGLFKIRRGTNECGIEDEAVAAKMK